MCGMQNLIGVVTFREKRKKGIMLAKSRALRCVASQHELILQVHT